MEITCARCHQAIEDGNCFCPTCGLPQLVYSADSIPGQAPAERFTAPIRDAGTVDWKRAMRLCVAFAAPAGILCPMLYPMGFLGLFLMALTAYWAVVLYVRSQRPAWITVGAGARIGLVTGLLSSWLGAALIGGTLFIARFVLHEGKTIDDLWDDQMVGRMTAQWASMGMDAASIAAMKAWVLSAEGRAGFMFAAVLILVSLLIVFAVGGGALGARSQAGARRPEV